MPALADTSGVWNGTFDASLPCFFESKTLRFAGPITLWIQEFPGQTAQFTAKGTASAAFIDIFTCEVKGSEALPIGINGQIAGNAVSESVMLFPTGALSGRLARSRATP